MIDFEEAVIGGFLDLSKRLGGIEVLKDDKVLKITDPRLAIQFLRIGESILERPPLSFDIAIEIGNPNYDSVFPWLNKSMIKYWYENESVLKRPKYVSFLFSTPSSVKTYKYRRRKELENAGYNPDDIIIIPLEGCIPELLTEVMGVLYLKSKGYLVTDLYGVRSMKVEGVPDIIAWKSDTLEKLRNKGFVQYGGTLTDLALVRVFGKFKNSINEPVHQPETLVVEVKYSLTSIGTAITQLYMRGRNRNPGYLTSKYFDKGFGMVALCRGLTDERAGIISFDKEGFYFYDDRMQKDWNLKPVNSRSDPDRKALFLHEMENVVKQTLLSNLKHKEILELINGWEDLETNDILRRLYLLPIDSVLTYLDEKLK